MNENPQTGGSGSLHENMGLVALVIFFAYDAAIKVIARSKTIWHVYPVLVCLAGVIILLCSVIWIGIPIWNRRVKGESEREMKEGDETSVYLGKTKKGESLYLPQKYRVGHAEVVGTTGVGKTESAVLPLAIRDLETGAGVLIVDGKSDWSFIEKFYAYAVHYHRKSDFRLFSLAHPDQSATFNPLVGGNAEQITERVFSAFTFEDEYYKSVQYQIFHSLIRLVIDAGEVPTFILIRQLLRNKDLLNSWIESTNDMLLQDDLKKFAGLSESDRSNRSSGLDAQLSHFTTGELAVLFNATDPMIRMDDVLAENLVCYFQLPSMMFHELSAITGRLVLQAFESAVSNRQINSKTKGRFFSCFLDDFQDYIYEGFAALLNKSRSANIGVVFSHQSLGDLEKVSPAFKDIVLTCTNIKFVMRSNHPATCDHFSESFGTKTVEKMTERSKTDLLGKSKTGDASVRETEEFIIHPNQIRNFGTGEGVVSIPDFGGVKTEIVRFARRENIEPVTLPMVFKAPIATLKESTIKTLQGTGTPPPTNLPKPVLKSEQTEMPRLNAEEMKSTRVNMPNEPKPTNSGVENAKTD